MLNVGGGEFLVILLVALIVLGPQKLPEAARQIAGFARELRRISAGFQSELKAAMDDPIEAAARERGNQVSSPNKVTSSEETPAPTAQPGSTAESGTDPFTRSSAATVGMYDVAKRQMAANGSPTADGENETTADTDAVVDAGADPDGEVGVDVEVAAELEADAGDAEVER